ncbi:type II toxin-antitoxin system Phd/YefM family antitoxin [Actinoallomurus sp. NBC_01490]|uniref:type II toxin-antitoxin system Phd/YefM family antitoxin n=1 Tax=Actinoallomurus sp. NBC_01490 TaxID=2903557 RepID=UPI002E31D16F|nr:type II toxin-antitoxin system prevent-host-death family antitoxin [Actinoallomurus sp. NBC_01490]
MTMAHEREPGQRWQVQEAKQRFSEVLRKVHDEGPQIITRHGEEVAIIIDMSEYRHGRDTKMSFHDFLLSGPAFPDDFDTLIERDKDYGRDVSRLFEE